MIWFIIFWLSLIILLLIWVIVNILRKNEILEDFLIRAHSQSQTVIDNMRELDRREMFEKDDDVGIIFMEMCNLIEEYADFLGIKKEDKYGE